MKCPVTASRTQEALARQSLGYLNGFIEMAHEGVFIQHTISGKGGLMLGKCKLAPGGELPIHKHVQAEIYMIEPSKGTAIHHNNGVDTIVGQYAMPIHVASNVPHGIRNDSDDFVEFTYIFPTSTLDEVEYNFD